MTLLRQSFNDFLNAPGPSTPRMGGRGRGRGRGGGRGGGGGQSFGSGSGGGSSNLSKSDYSNVPFDYATINHQKYNKMDGYVQPFGPTPTDSPRGRGSLTPRGRGRGRGGFGNTSGTPQPDSGQSTPVRGLGSRGRGGGLGFRGKEKSLGYKVTSTVGRDGVTWGGRGAPLFVKAGELFKDGEVDVIKKGDGDEFTVEKLPLSDPSAPQMTDLADDIEVEIRTEDSITSNTAFRYPQPVASPPANASSIDPPEQQDPAALSVGGISQSLPEIEDRVPIYPSAPDEDVDVAIEVEEETAFYVDTRSEPTVTAPAGESFSVDETPAPASPSPDEDAFFVDTTPAVGSSATNDARPTYTSEPISHIGQRGNSPPSPAAEEEEIVFAPRTFKQPQPITIDMPQASSSRPRPTGRRSVSPVMAHTAGYPRTMTRSQKKALKKDKKMGKGKKAKRAKRQAELAEASDIEWGSDGPPGGKGGDDMLTMDGVEESDGEDDVAVLRDYLAGTLLNERPAQGDDSEEDDEVVEELDSDEVDEAIEIDMMRQFGEGVRQWNESGSIDDGGSSAEEADSQASDESSAIDSEEDDEDFDIDIEIDSGSGSSDGGDSDSDSGDATEDDIDRQLALALEQGEEDSEMEELFTGKSGWGGDADWFIQSMEDALDSKAMTFKNKRAKSNSKLFHAIENGDFGDLDLPTEPAKKNKNKHVPAELQAQWEKDRLAKAEKKRQRALDRLIAEIDPYPAARTKKGKMKANGKGKGKGKDLITAASLAHLIPASASQVAEMFDISSGDEVDPSELGRVRPKRGMGLLPDITESWMKQLNDQIRDFLDDGGKQTFSLPPMDAEGRKKIHMLAECYGLGSKSRGGGRARFTILIKKARSGEVVDHDQIARLMEASTLKRGNFYKNFYGGGGGKLKAKKTDKSGTKSGKAGPARQSMPSLRARDGEQVGGGADKIGMDNVGHRLLSKMGWAEGDCIGRTGGLDAPIVAIVKNTKSGLGA